MILKNVLKKKYNLQPNVIQSSQQPSQPSQQSFQPSQPQQMSEQSQAQQSFQQPQQISTTRIITTSSTR